jgi:hypothetical protein
MQKLLLSLAALGLLGISSPSHASPVTETFDFTLSGSGGPNCSGAGGCGSVTVTGDTTTSLTYTVNLGSILFHDSPATTSPTNGVFWFQLTDSQSTGVSVASTTSNGANFTYSGPTLGTYVPNPGANFPGTYNYAVSCSSSAGGNVCGSTYTFTASLTAAEQLAHDALVIGAPKGGGGFTQDNVAFVADLSASGNTGLAGTTLAPAVPEATTWAMMILGFCSVGFVAYRRRANGAFRFV